MNESGKSDKPIVPMKSAKMDYWDFHQWYVERMEGRGLAKEKLTRQTRPIGHSAEWGFAPKVCQLSRVGCVLHAGHVGRLI